MSDRAGVRFANVMEASWGVVFGQPWRDTAPSAGLLYPCRWSGEGCPSVPRGPGPSALPVPVTTTGGDSVSVSLTPTPCPLTLAQRSPSRALSVSPSRSPTPSATPVPFDLAKGPGPWVPDTLSGVPSNETVLIIARNRAKDAMHWLNDQPYRYVVMEKGLPDGTPNNLRENRGGDAASYTQFIVEHWEHLPARMMFMHGHGKSNHNGVCAL